MLLRQKVACTTAPNPRSERQAQGKCRAGSVGEKDGDPSPEPTGSWHRQGVACSCSANWLLWLLGCWIYFLFHPPGIPAYIVVPRTAPQCKQDAIRAYGATLVPCEPSDKVRHREDWPGTRPSQSER